MKPALLNIRVTRQTDGHGCGYCAMASIYRYYGMDPRRLRLRERLGTDNHALPYGLPFRDRLQTLTDRLGIETRGTLCPDLFAVLASNGFDVACACRDYAKPLRRHLRLGHPALALAGGMAHWIVAAGMDDESVLVLDSSGYSDPSGKNRLRYRLTHDEFADAIDGLVLVRPRRRPRLLTAADYAKAYLRGAVFALKCAGAKVPRWLGKMLPG